MGQKIDLVRQVQGTLQPQNGGLGADLLPKFSDRIIPSGTQNGSNVTFTLPEVPIPAASLLLFQNRALQDQTTDYTLSGSTITFTVPPLSGDKIRAWYRSVQYLLAFSEALGMLDFMNTIYLKTVSDNMLNLSDVVRLVLACQEVLSGAMTLSDGFAFVLT